MTDFHRRVATEAELDGLLRYVAAHWNDLVCDNSCVQSSAPSPTMQTHPRHRARSEMDARARAEVADLRYAIRYSSADDAVSEKEDPAAIERHLRSINSPEDMAQIEVLRIPAERSQTKRQGALYLPHPYVVPGGRFNEMVRWTDADDLMRQYAWDSFFIFLGLLQDGKHRLAQAMVDNQIYCVDAYGLVPNGNRCVDDLSEH